ncbi:MAG: FAD-binding protein, partial [Cytophagaceae bacterium]|nr:FAD-binding protein [Gemmatimonadaceae bacterium]
MTVAWNEDGTLLSGGGPQPPGANGPSAPSLRPRDVADLAEIVANAAATGQPLRIAGAATWLDAGCIVAPRASVLDLSALSGIVEYVPGDLTLTALAGTPLSVIVEATAANGQWLSLDPFGALTARVDYDSWQTAAAAARVYNTTGSYTPGSVRKATLALTVTPGSITVTSSSISYVTYVSNTDAGTGYGTVLTNTLPVGITVNVAATNAANPGYTVATSAGPGGRQTLTWALNNLASGATVPITLIANVGIIPGCAITIVPAIDLITATWGCDSTIYTTVTRVSPTYNFPAGKMQVVHDSTQTVARLCDLGKIVVIVKNTGPTNIQGVIVSDVVPPSAGLSISGTVQYRLNGGALQNALSPPTGNGSSGNPYVWTSAQIPALAELVPVGVSGTNQVNIEFGLAATETLAGQNPVLSASATATISCGNAVTSPAQPFTIPVERPDITVVKTGRNITANGAAPFTTTVYGGLSDVVEWRIVITNNGTATAQNLRLSDVLSGSGGTAVINGPGLGVNTPFAAAQVISLPNLNASAAVTYTITETLGNNCLTSSRLADVTWGCTNNGATVRSNVVTPGTPTSAATIVMLPVIISGTELTQAITSLPGGRAQVTVTFSNSGGTAYNPVITATIPAGSTLDTTGPVTRGGTAVDITTVTRTGTVTSPIFTFTGASSPHMVRFGETVTVSYYVRPTVFDTQNATSFTAASGSNLVSAETTLDPTVPATANITAQLNYTTSCGVANSTTDNVSYNPLTPDLDVTSTTPTNALITNTTAANYDFVITNNGEGGSLASHITIDFPGLGSSWTVTSVTVNAATAGTGGTLATVGATATQVVGVWTLSPAQLGTLGATGTITVRARLAYSNTPGPLALRLRVRGDSRSQDGTTSNGDYSLDQRGQRIVGVVLAKTLQATSEPLTTTTNVNVGEDVTYRVRTDFFGVEDDLTTVVLNDTPADSNTSAHTGLAYVSHSFTSNN